MKKLALLLPLLALATAGCGERSQYVAAEIERDITNADHSESVEIRVPQSRKPLYYATTWVFCTEESSEEFHRDLTGPHYKTEARNPDEVQWFINIYRVPELSGRPLLPLDFDDNGKSLHPPTPAIPAISLSRKDDGILVFTLGPEAYEQYPNRPLAIYLNDERKLTSQLLPDSATNAPAASEPHAEPAENAEPEPHAEAAETIDIPFYYEWANPGTPEEMRKALEPVQRTIDGLDRLVSSSCTINPSGRADYTVAFSTKGDTETGTRETIRILYEALDNVPVPDGAVLRVPFLVKGVKTPGVPAAQSPAEESHAESAEDAEN